MAYINVPTGYDKEIVVDAVLTLKGLSKIASGIPLQIRSFALFDTEIDYELYNPNLPDGIAAETAIAKLPLLEAIKRGDQNGTTYGLKTMPGQSMLSATAPQVLYANVKYGISPKITPTPVDVSKVSYKITITAKQVNGKAVDLTPFLLEGVDTRVRQA